MNDLSAAKQEKETLINHAVAIIQCRGSLICDFKVVSEMRTQTAIMKISLKPLSETRFLHNLSVKKQ